MKKPYSVCDSSGMMGIRAASAHVCRRSENELSTVGAVGGGLVFQTDGSGCGSRPDCHLPAVRPCARRFYRCTHRTIYSYNDHSTVQLSPDHNGCHRIVVRTELRLTLIGHGVDCK